MSLHQGHRTLPQAVLGLVLDGSQVPSWLCLLRAIVDVDIEDGSPLIIGLTEQEQLRQRAVIFCRCAQTCRSAYEAAVQLLVDISPWQAADLPKSVQASRTIPEILFAMAREHWLKPRPEYGARWRKLTCQSPIIATLANCVLGPLRAPALHFYEAGEVSRPHFMYAREPQAKEMAGLLAGCPSFLQQCRERAERDQDCTGPVFVPGEIVELTEFGTEHQAFKLRLGRAFGEDACQNAWYEGGLAATAGSSYGDAVLQTIPNGHAKGVVLFNDGADYCVATQLSTEQQLEFQERLFVDDQSWKELTAPGNLAHHMWFYPVARKSYTTYNIPDGMDGDRTVDSNGFHTDGIRTGVWLRQIATPAPGVGASLREAIGLAASSMPIRAGHEAVQDYVTTSGDLVHVFQGYQGSFKSLPDTGLRLGGSHAFNFAKSIVEHLSSVASWAAFVRDLDPAASFEIHMHHKLDSHTYGRTADSWNSTNPAVQRKRDIVLVYRLGRRS
jgi:hypothetical protein